MYCSPSNVDFCMNYKYSDSVGGVHIYCSYENTYNIDCGVRPVVTLDITELSGKDGNGVWQIE